MISPDVAALVDHVRLGFIATVNADGTPNLSPKGTLISLDERHLFFANIASPNTVRNLKERPAAEVNVVDPIRRRGFRFKVRGRIVTSGSDFDRAIKKLSAIGAGREDYEFSEIVLLEVLEVSELLSPAYFRGRTEQSLIEHFSKHYRL